MKTNGSLVESLSVKEIVEMLKSMNSGKAEGFDKTNIEMLKAGQGVVVSQLPFQHFWTSGQVPED